MCRFAARESSHRARCSGPTRACHAGFEWDAEGSLTRRPITARTRARIPHARATTRVVTKVGSLTQPAARPSRGPAARRGPGRNRRDDPAGRDRRGDLLGGNRAFPMAGARARRAGGVWLRRGVVVAGLPAAAQVARTLHPRETMAPRALRRRRVQLRHPTDDGSNAAAGMTRDFRAWTDGKHCRRRLTAGRKEYRAPPNDEHGLRRYS